MSFTGKFLTTTAAVFAFSTASFAQDAVTKDTIVATVNETEITVGHVLSLASRLPDQFQNIGNEELFFGIVDQLIQQESLSTLVSGDSIVIKLARENELRALMASEAIANIYKDGITEEKIKAIYDERFATSENAEQEYKTSHILVETEEEALAVKAEVEGGADFAEVAKEKSTGPSGVQGGDLGWASKGMFVPEFEAAMLEAEVGAVTAPVKTQFGWHVITVSETRAKPAPDLASVRGSIEEELKAQVLQDKLTELQAANPVKRMVDGIDPNVVRNFDLLND